MAADAANSRPFALTHARWRRSVVRLARSPLMRWLPTLAILWAVGALPARADEVGLRSVVHVPADLPCVRAESLLPRVHAWLGDVALAPGLSVEITEGHAGDADYVAYRLLRDGEPVAVRTLTPAPAECEARQAALALALAFALRASATEGVASAPTPRADARLKGYATLRAGRSIRVLPDPAWAAQLELAIAARRLLGAALSLGWTQAADMRLGNAGGHFNAQLVTLGLQACLNSPSWGRVGVALCAGAAGGLLRTRGRGFAKDFVRRGAYAAATLGLGLRAELGAGLHLELRGALSALLTPIAVRARESPRSVVQRTFRSLGAEAQLGLVYSFRVR